MWHWKNFGVMKTFLLSKLIRYPLCARSVKNLGGLELLVVTEVIQLCFRLVIELIDSPRWDYCPLNDILLKRNGSISACPAYRYAFLFHWEPDSKTSNFIMWWQIIIKIAESSRSEANKREFILWTTSIICIVVYEESDLLTFRLALAIALTTLRGFSASLMHWSSF